MSTDFLALSKVQQKIWDGRLPLEISLASAECRTFDQSDPFLISLPRLSYLPLLLPRLLDFFGPFLISDVEKTSPWDGYLTYDDVPLKWHLPVGLLYDIYALSSQGPDSQLPLPFRLILHFSDTSPTLPNGNTNLIKPEPIVLHDSFINSVKEADFLRSGTAKPIMSLSAADSKALWSSTQDNDLETHAKVYNSLLPGQFRNIPIRIYLPSSPSQDPSKAQIKVLQSHVPPFITSVSPNSVTQRTPTQGQPQTLGTALHTMLPNLFPSRRTPILGRPILHGAAVPMGANLEELARWACYADGWLGVVIYRPAAYMVLVTIFAAALRGVVVGALRKRRSISETYLNDAGFELNRNLKRCKEAQLRSTLDTGRHETLAGDIEESK